MQGLRKAVLHEKCRGTYSLFCSKMPSFQMCLFCLPQVGKLSLEIQVKLFASAHGSGQEVIPRHQTGGGGEYPSSLHCSFSASHSLEWKRKRVRERRNCGGEETVEQGHGRVGEEEAATSSGTVCVFGMLPQVSEHLEPALSWIFPYRCPPNPLYLLLCQNVSRYHVLAFFILHVLSF